MDAKEFNCDSLILGVGISESIISAATATHGKTSLNLESGTIYSGALMTVTIRELEKLLKDESEKNKKAPIRKDFQANFVEEGIQNIEGFVEKYGFRGYNIDLNPRLIFSTGKATDMMIEAQIDNYITFRSLKGLYFVDSFDESSKLNKVPIDKGGIFSSKAFTLAEKKELFNFLNTAMRYFRKEESMAEDYNSISDFRKTVYEESQSYLNELKRDEDILKGSLVKFIETAGVKSSKLIRLITACMCNFRINPLSGKSSPFEDHSAKSMLTRLIRFVDSMNIHSNLPYVYPIYGTGDITQICSRISAVYNSTFMLGIDFKIDKVNYSEEHGYSIDLSLEKEPAKVTCKKIYIGSEYRDLKEVFLKAECDKAEEKVGKDEEEMKDKLPDTQEESEKKEHAGNSSDKVRYISFVCNYKQKEHDEDEEQREPIFPCLTYIDMPPGKSDNVQSNHPICSLVVDHTCGTVPETSLIIYFSYYCDEQTKVDDNALLAGFTEVMKRTHPQIESIQPVFSLSHWQSYEQADIIHLEKNVVLLPDTDFDLDLERVFLESKKEVVPEGEGKLFTREQNEVPQTYEQAEEDFTERALNELEKLGLTNQPSPN